MSILDFLAVSVRSRESAARGPPTWKYAPSLRVRRAPHVAQPVAPRRSLRAPFSRSVCGSVVACRGTADSSASRRRAGRTVRLDDCAHREPPGPNPCPAGRAGLERSCRRPKAGAPRLRRGLVHAVRGPRQDVRQARVGGDARVLPRAGLRHRRRCRRRRGGGAARRSRAPVARHSRPRRCGDRPRRRRQRPPRMARRAREDCSARSLHRRAPRRRNRSARAPPRCTRR
jgi:hypothetical protein